MTLLPVDIWLCVINEDMRIFNTLVRTCRALSTIDTAANMRKKYGGEQQVKTLEQSVSITLPTVNGKIHAAGTFLSGDENHVLCVNSNYGRLVGNGRAPSFQYTSRVVCSDIIVPLKRIEIYARDGVLHRENAPAMVCSSSVVNRPLVLEVYARNGYVTRVKYCAPGNEQILIDIDTTNSSTIVQFWGCVRMYHGLCTSIDDVTRNTQLTGFERHTNIRPCEVSEILKNILEWMGDFWNLRTMATTIEAITSTILDAVGAAHTFRMVLWRE